MHWDPAQIPVALGAATAIGIGIRGQIQEYKRYAREGWPQPDGSNVRFPKDKFWGDPKAATRVDHFTRGATEHETPNGEA